MENTINNQKQASGCPVEMEIDPKFLSTTANQMRGIDFILEKNKLLPDPMVMLIAEEMAKKILKPAADWSKMFCGDISAHLLPKTSN